jgi:predicted GNAT superfamily acetyltransferase
MQATPPHPIPAQPSPRLRGIEEGDVAEVLALNEANVELLAPLDSARLAQLQGWARRADVIDVDGAFAGFVITMGPGTDYDSPNYRWFAARYGAAFHYLDRIVLVDAFRRRGLASAVYDVVEADAAPVGRLVLEVNAEPPNPASLAFHAARGYAEVGRLGGPGKTVSLMAKRLTP